MDCSEEEETNFEENDSLGEVSENLGKDKYTKAELLDLLSENDGDIPATVRTILQDLTSDSLQNLSSQVEKKKTKKEKNLVRKVERIKVT